MGISTFKFIACLKTLFSPNLPCVFPFIFLPLKNTLIIESVLVLFSLKTSPYGSKILPSLDAV